MSAGEIEPLIDALRERLRERYGWTHLEVEAAILDDRVRLHGTIAVPRLARIVREHLAPHVHAELELDLRPLPILAWHGLPEGGLALWAEHPSRPTQALATELARADGPVGRLALDGPASLVRARDGTVGWTTATLGPREGARLLTEPRLPSDDPGPALCAAALEHLGVPYRLGGNGLEQIDCSALTQRAFQAALGVLLPRNSNDQLAIAGPGELITHALGEAGDLVFMRSRSTSRMHVGVLSGRGTVIHASRSRGLVVDEPTAELERDAQWLRRVRWRAVLDWAKTQVGREHVELP